MKIDDHDGLFRVYPNVAIVGGLQSQGGKGEVVVCYCEPLATPDLESSGFYNVGGYPPDRIVVI